MIVEGEQEDVELTKVGFDPAKSMERKIYLHPASLSLLAYILPISPKPIIPIVKFSSTRFRDPSIFVAKALDAILSNTPAEPVVKVLHPLPPVLLG
jgi:hypothetical protein